MTPEEKTWQPHASLPWEHIWKMLHGFFWNYVAALKTSITFVPFSLNSGFSHNYSLEQKTAWRGTKA
jgi:hypothetical protein